MPVEIESYVHRIGRTGRAGATGIALTFCDPAERSKLRAIERIIRQPIEVRKLPQLVAALAPAVANHHFDDRDQHRAGRPIHSASGVPPRGTPGETVQHSDHHARHPFDSKRNGGPQRRRDFSRR